MRWRLHLADSFDYDIPNVSEKVVRVILSYTDYVNRFVWRKGQRRMWVGGSQSNVEGQHPGSILHVIARCRVK